MKINDVDDECIIFLFCFEVVVVIAQVIIDVFVSGCIIIIVICSAVIWFDTTDVEALKSASTFLNGNGTIGMNLGYGKGTNRLGIKLIPCLFFY